MLAPLERQFPGQQSPKRAERVKKHIGEQRVRANNAGLHSRENRCHRRRIFDRIKLALILDGLLDTIVLFHSNRLDPSHVLAPPISPRNSAKSIVTRRPALFPRRFLLPPSKFRPPLASA